ncbi:hypothetical protein [Wenzhouxiangella sp. XN24]|uniref:hypothetical protein n=1 Tax=Wenzhouxiangella sp. XN24 TaxID=2713569 RepID=UPI0013EADE35|nr:hypothetical protein [Wenzhouxiangella sp. XN24]NGX16838.1 hypothetical protein [Wenzhouxiangella sp. XN24]
MRITPTTSLQELAAMVSETLESHGILATLSGGAAVSLYTSNRYMSEDLDFVTGALVKELAAALQPLGFTHSGRPRMSVFTHPSTTWYLEFPPSPISFGSRYISPDQCVLMPTRLGNIRIISPTHSVMDRLIAAAVWKEPQSMEQAVMVAESQADRIDWPDLQRWILEEGIADDRHIQLFFSRLNGNKRVGPP